MHQSGTYQSGHIQIWSYLTVSLSCEMQLNIELENSNSHILVNNIVYSRNQSMKNSITRKKKQVNIPV